MYLELLSQAPEAPERRVRLLFLHGVCLGAWVWRNNFMTFHARQGFRCYALSLRGHGGSDGADNVRHWRLRDFADDVAWAVDRISGPVVIVGHSMGGGVAQFYLQRGGQAAGLVLMASAPPHGLMRASIAMFHHHPELWRELSRLRFISLRRADYSIIERGMVSQPLGRAEREKFLARLSEPAIDAGLELMGWRPIAPLPWLAPPVMVVGGERDAFIPPVDVQLTGVYYGVRPNMILGCAHAMMLDPAWEVAAEQIGAWLIATFEGESAA